MRPILFAPSETDFNTLGLGVLADATNCIVTEERNGIFELEMQYPITGQHYSSIQSRCLIGVHCPPMDRVEPFRIYKITRPLKGIITIYAQHLSYDLSGIVVKPFTATTSASAWAKLKTESVTENPFTFAAPNFTTVANFTVKTPSTVRSLFGGQSGSLLDVYGGEYTYTQYTVSWRRARGSNRGVAIRYGKNLTDLTQEENISSVVTGVYPYWASENEYVELPEKIVPAPGTYDYTKIKPLDASGEFDEAPTEDKLRTWAQNYVKNNDVGIPKVSIAVKFQPLAQTEEYKDIAALEEVKLCDTVTVIFDKLGVNATAKCIKTVYDVLKGKLKEITLGDARTNITDTILSQVQEVKKISNPEFLEPYVASASKLITGNKGGYVVLHSSTGVATPDEILVMDTPDIGTATQVWRWNKSGLGYSSSGYEGEYALAMTMDGKIVADFVATGTLDAAEINVINLIAESVKSATNGAIMQVSGGELAMTKAGGSTKNVHIAFVAEGNPIIYLRDTDGDISGNLAELSPHHLKIGGTSVSPKFEVRASEDNSKILFDDLSPSGNGNCTWQYISAIGKTVLVKQ